MSESNGKCGAKAKGTGEPCRRPAGWGTPHAVGRCKLHGGLSPIKHGRYSKIRRGEISKLIEQHEADPDPLNFLPELAALRALLEDYLERYDEYREAIIHWHNEAGDEQPHRMMDIASAKALIAEIGRLGERISRIWSQNAISQPELFRFIAELERVIRNEVQDPITVQRIGRGISQIRLRPNGFA